MGTHKGTLVQRCTSPMQALYKCLLALQYRVILQVTTYVRRPYSTSVVQTSFAVSYIFVVSHKTSYKTKFGPYTRGRHPQPSLIRPARSPACLPQYNNDITCHPPSPTFRLCMGTPLQYNHCSTTIASQPLQYNHCKLRLWIVTLRIKLVPNAYLSIFSVLPLMFTVYH